MSGFKANLLLAERACFLDADGDRSPCRTLFPILVLLEAHVAIQRLSSHVDVVSKHLLSLIRHIFLFVWMDFEIAVRDVAVDLVAWYRDVANRLLLHTVDDQNLNGVVAVAVSRDHILAQLLHSLVEGFKLLLRDVAP